MNPKTTLSPTRVAIRFLEAKEKYPWDECIKDQMDQYGSKETAEKVCGAIKAKSQGGKAAAMNLCVVCGKPGSVVRFTVRGMDKTPIAGRVFLKGTVLCDDHQEMCDEHMVSRD
jgi:hypothetical protein